MTAIDLNSATLTQLKEKSRVAWKDAKQIVLYNHWLKENLSAMLPAEPLDVPDGTYVSLVTYDFQMVINLWLPRDMSKVAPLKQLLQQRGWKEISSVQYPNSPDIYIRLEWNKRAPTVSKGYGNGVPVYLDLNLQATSKAAKCVVKILRYEEKLERKPIYEVICPEGAAEMEKLDGQSDTVEQPTS